MNTIKWCIADKTRQMRLDTLNYSTEEIRQSLFIIEAELCRVHETISIEVNKQLIDKKL